MNSRFVEADPNSVLNPLGTVRILPIPYDSTASTIPGSRLAPDAITYASDRVETFDEELEWDASKFVRLRMQEAVPLNFSSVEAMMGDIKAAADRHLKDGDFLFSLGGEHSVSVPLIEAHSQRYPGLHVVQIDAHADLLDTQHQNRYAHGCVNRRVLEFGVPVTQIGIRNISVEEFEFMQSDHGLPIQTFKASSIKQPDNFEKLLDYLAEDISGPIYLNIDVDGLDPSVIPAVAEPEPNGLSWNEMMAIIRTLCSRHNVVGADVVELTPIPGLHFVDFAVAKLCYKIITYIYHEKRKSIS